jgi:Mg2+-importing ATPase
MSKLHSTVFPKNLFVLIPHDKPHIQVSEILIESASMEVADVYKRFATGPAGLTAEEARTRLAKYGPNVLAKDQRIGIGKLIWHAVLNPLVILLTVLASVSFATGDFRAGTMISLMIALSLGLKLVQEAKADSAAAKLKAMISVTATVTRDGQPQEIAVSQLVPGDVVTLAAGDMIPADVRMLVAKDLFVIQSSLKIGFRIAQQSGTGGCRSRPESAGATTTSSIGSRLARKCRSCCGVNCGSRTVRTLNKFRK